MSNPDPKNLVKSSNKVAPENSSKEEILKEVEIDDYILYGINRKMLEIWTFPYLVIKEAESPQSAIISPCGRYVAYGSKKYVCVWNLYENREELKRIQPGDVNSVCFSPNGDFLVSGTKEGNLTVYEIKEKRIVFGENHLKSVNSVCYSPSGLYVVSGSDDETIKVWNIKEKQNIFTGKHTGEVLVVTFSYDGNTLASGSEDCAVKVWDLKSEEPLIEYKHSGSVLSICYSYDSSLLASGSQDKNVKVWDIQKKSIKHEISHLGPVTSVCFSPIEKILASGSDDSYFKIWNFNEMREEFCGSHFKEITKVCFSNNGKFLATGSKDGAIKVWDIKLQKEIYCDRLRGEVSSISFSPDDHFLASGSEYSGVMIRNLKDRREEFRGQHSNAISSIWLSHDYLASGSYDHSIKVWDLRTKMEIFRGLHSGEVTSVSILFSRKYVASGSKDKTVKVWNIYKLKEVFTGMHNGEVKSICFNPGFDKYDLASGSADSTIKIWDIKKKELIFTIKHLESVNSICFSGSGKYLASGSSDKTIKILHNYKEIFKGNHNSKVNLVDFSHDSKFVVSGSTEALKLWNIEHKAEEFHILNKVVYVSLCFSPTNDFLAYVSSGQTFKVWDIDKKQEIFTGKHLGEITTVKFLYKNYLASGSSDGSVKIWNIKEMREVFTGYHSDSISSLSVSFSLASGSKDGTIKVWKFVKEDSFRHFNDGKVIEVCFSADSKLLASGSSGGRIKVWNMIDKTEEFTAEIGGSIYSICFSPQGNFIATGSDEKSVDIWNIKEKRKEFGWEHSQGVSKVCYSNEGNYLASGSWDGTIQVWNIDDEKLVFSDRHSRSVNDLSFSSENYLASASQDMTIKVWDLQQKVSIFIGNHSDGVTSVLFSNFGNILASGSEDSLVKVWDFVKQQELFTGYHASKISSICFSADGNLLASGSHDSSVKVWNLKEMRQELHLEHLGPLHSVTFSPDSSYLASGTTNGILTVWNLKEKRKQFEKKDLLTNGFLVVAFSPNGKMLASGTKDNTVFCFNINGIDDENIDNFVSDANINQLDSSTDHPSDIKYPLTNEKIDFMCISKNLKYSAIGFSNNNEINIIGLNNMESLGIFIGNSKSTSFSPYDELFAFGLLGNGLKIWDLIEGGEICDLNLSSEVTSICFPMQNEIIASGSKNFLITIWNFKNVEVIFHLSGHDSYITSMCFTIDDYYLASGSIDGKIKIWDIVKNSEIDSFCDHFKNVNSLCFTDDSEILVSGSSDSKLILWSMRRRESIWKFQNHYRDITSVSISHDSKLLLSGSIDKTINIFSLESFTKVFNFKFSSSIVCIRFSTNDQQFIIGLSEGLIKRFKYESNENYKQNARNKEFPYKFEVNQIFMLYEEEENEGLLKSKNTGLANKSKHDFADVNKIQNNSLHEKYTQDANKYRIIQSKYGFEILNHEGEPLNYFNIIDYRNSEITFQTNRFGLLKDYSEKIKLELKEPLVMNKLYIDLLNYQKFHKCTVQIDISVLPSNFLMMRPSSLSDSFLYEPLEYLNAIQAIKDNSFNVTPSDFNIQISEYKYTILHFCSYLGDLTTLEKFLADNSEDIDIVADIFGKSPLYYSFNKKHLSCYEFILDYLIKMDSGNTDRLIKNLHSTRNDFLIIIESASSKLSALLSKILITDKKIYQVPTSAKLPSQIISQSILPSLEDVKSLFESNKHSKKIGGVYKFSAFALPINPYSVQNIRALQVIYECRNKKIYDDWLIQIIINYNWESTFKWSVIYSVLIWIHIILYCYSFRDVNNANMLIPFWCTYFFTLLWEVLQIRSNFESYLRNPWNVIDLILLIWTPIWSCFRILSIDFLYSDLIIASLLMIRGIASFKVFNGTRYYIRLILQSIDDIKYFLIIFIYSTIFFTILLYIVIQNDSEQSKNFFDILKQSWALSVGGDTTIDSQYGIIFFVVILSSITNLILMLNMLISILGDTFDLFVVEKNVIDYKEKISLSLEVQNAFFWQARSNKSYFIHILTFLFENKLGNENDWQGKILYSEQKQEIRMEFIIEKINKLDSKVGILHSEIDQKFDDKFNGIDQKFGVKFNGIDEKIDSLEKKIDSINSNLLELVKGIDQKK